MPFFIVESDITKMDTEAVVVSADVSLKATGGMISDVYGAVAEPKNLEKVCGRIGFCGGCECVVTQSFGLPSKYIIHSVAPIYTDSGNRAEQYIKTCYKNAVYMARIKMFESVAVPLIGTGKKGFPKKMVCDIATDVIKEFLNKYDMDIRFVVRNRESFIIDDSIANSVQNYLANNYTSKNANLFENTSNFAQAFSVDFNDFSQVSVMLSTDEAVENDNTTQPENSDSNPKEVENFADLLKQKMKQHKIKESKAYKKSNIEKNAFARLKNGINTAPTKAVLLAIAIGLEMDLPETEQFVKACGYEFSHSDKCDVIVRYFIENKIYDIFQINKVLFSFNEEQLGTLI